MEWFKEESLKLNGMVNTLRREVEKWKSKSLATTDELKFIET
jgi:hypothetical protein